jgi:superfamily II DNA/RNA helicase
MDMRGERQALHRGAHIVVGTPGRLCETTLVFCATRATVNHMTARFGNRGFSVVALSSELSQKERTTLCRLRATVRPRVMGHRA